MKMYSSVLYVWFVQELRRWVVTPLLWITALVSVFLTVTAVYGTIELGEQRISEGVSDPAALTELALSMSFGGILTTTFLGVFIVGSDFDSKFSNRLLMLNRSVTAFIVVKSLVGVLLSLVVGTVTLLTGRVSTQLFLSGKDIDFLPQIEVFEWVQGYILMYVTGAVWGVAVALLFRNTVLAMSINFLYQLVAESLIVKAFPDIANWLPGGAQIAMVQDPSHPERFDVLPGLGIYVMWLLIVFAVSLFFLRRSSQPLQGLSVRGRGAKRKEAVSFSPMQ